jgi:hypothetical protein
MGQPPCSKKRFHEIERVMEMFDVADHRMLIADTT